MRISTAAPLPSRIRGDARALLRALLPLPVRKRLAVWVGRRSRLPGHHWWAAELVRDLAERDVNAYHQFLWGNHLAYARTYEVEERFGAERIHPTRHLLFRELRRLLDGREPESVLEVGCSMGYLLRHVEERVFPSARVLEGIDIDDYAVRAGAGHLRRLGSRVRLARGDMVDLPRLLAGKRFDLTLCAGTLMYLREEDAREVVRAMLRHSSGVVALAGLAHPDADNAALERSVPRDFDRSWIHNLDAMVERAGGTVLYRRWDGARKVAGNTVYFVFAAPGAGGESPA